MVKTVIGGKLADITKENGKIRIVFHPVRKEARHTKANVFTIKLSKSDLGSIRKAF